MLRRYGSNKRNPNPPWPNEQSVVVVPPGVNATAIGRQDAEVRSMPDEEKITVTDKSEIIHNNAETSNNLEKSEIENSESFEDRDRPIKTYIPETSMRNSDLVRNNPMSGTRTDINRNCGIMSANSFLCGHTGKMVRVEFLFGENTHVEKTGILQSVGKDFMVISEPGTNNSIVCSVKNVKFINIYNLNNKMNISEYGMNFSGM